jgi:predicted DNA repair protein MutK
MASSLLALIDDIATLLDDVGAMTKIATKKTAGVLGDDLALNAQQVSGIHADRELPVVWAVAKGSLLNKAILVPAALAISAFAPWAVTPLLMLGGAFLCYEGVEKLAHKFLHPPAEDAASHAHHREAVLDPSVDLVALEKDKVKGAVRTDFILSAEIIVITLGTVAEQPFQTQLAVLCAIALLMTVGVYGLVAGIVKLDDAGLWLSRRGAALQRQFGALILKVAPWLMKTLSVAGTAAMFLVGGGILEHGIGPLHHGVEVLVERLAALPGIGGVAAAIAPLLADLLIGAAAGAVVLAGVSVAKRVFGRAPAAAG